MGPDNSRHPTELDREHLIQQCSTRRTKRGGPGGQHRNKTESAIILTHDPTGVTAEANERRSQHENLEQAIFRLRVNLALEVRAERPRNEVPSLRWRSRSNNRRISVRSNHPDFPGLLAEALDVLSGQGYDMAAAATVLQVSNSQLIKFLAIDPRGLQLVNGRRAAIGLRPLKT